MFVILGKGTEGEDEFSRLTTTHPMRSLFLVSVLGLFLELALIRWIGTEVRIFAYLQNTILVVCFMGLGMGCLTCRKPIAMRAILLPLLAISLLMAIPFTRAWLGRISEMLSVPGDFLIWANLEKVGRLKVGIWLFVFLSAFRSPARLVVRRGRGVGPLVDRAGPALSGEKVRPLHGRGAPALTWFAGRELGATDVWWSPYQKLVVTERGPNESDEGAAERYFMTVNNTRYQGMLDLSEANVAANPGKFSVVLGNTWTVNAVIISGILALVLLANLIVALVGGLLQSLTFITGNKAPLLIVAGLYMDELMTRPRSSRPVSVETPD